MRALCSREDIEPTVYYCSRFGFEESRDPEFARAYKWDIPLLGGYESVFLRNLRRSLRVDTFFSLVNPAIVSELSRARFDAVLVHGYAHFTNWLAFLATQFKGTPLLLRGESQLLNPRPPAVRMAKNLILRPLLRRVSACLYIGSHNRDYWMHYGVPEERLYFAPYSVDNSYFRDAARKCRPIRDSIKQRWGLPHQVPVILYVGKFVSRKQPFLLLDAFRRLRQSHRAGLLLAGDGPLRAAIEQYIEDHETRDVCVTGFLNQTEIERAYAAADILVLPSSYETWGLVLNEGMNFRLPVVASDRVGAARDLVRPGQNGYIFPHGSVDSLFEALKRLVESAERRAQFGSRSLEIINDWDIENTADGIARAVISVSDGGSA